MESIKAIVTRVLHKNEKTGSVFAAIRYESPTGLVDAKMRGPGAELQPGDFVLAEGVWRPNTYQGRTEEIFTAKSVRPDLPATADGAARWFSTIFTAEKHGVTLATAKAFVDSVGAQAAALCERSPETVLKLSRDPKAFRDALLRDWGRRISGRQAITLMEKSGVDGRAIDSILDAFRDAALETIKRDPYRAARVKNVGFGNADKIGTHIGISAEDERRVGAALVEVLNGFRSDGHSFASASAVGARMVDGFNITMQTTINYILAMASSQTAPFVADRHEGQPVVALREMHNCEIAIAQNASLMLSAGRRNPPEKAKAVVDALFATEKYKKFDDVQRAAVVMAASEPLAILTGGPGTGKSTVSEVVVLAAEKLDSGPILLCAPTGKAAKRLEETTKRKAATIHHLLQAKEDLQNGRTVFGRNRANPLPAGCLVVVDEASMVDLTTMQALLDAIPRDGRLVLVGDRNQLPSVDAGAVLNDLMETRDAQGRRIVPCTELVNVYRQSGDSRIATGAGEIREGQVPFLSNKFDGGLVLYERNLDEVVARVKWVVEEACVKSLRLKPSQIAVLVPQAPGPAGTWQINRVLSKSLNPNGRAIPGIFTSATDHKDQPIPRVGDRVMLTENDDANDVMNGDVGTIVDAMPVSAPNGGSRNMIRIEFDCGKTVDYPASLWRRLILAYAMTVHKSQGSQYAAVVMPVCSTHSKMLDRSLLYTGWTRAKTALFLVGEREAIEAAVANVETSRRDTRLKGFLARAAMELGLAGKAEVATQAPARAPSPTISFNRPPPPRRPGLGVPVVAPAAIATPAAATVSDAAPPAPPLRRAPPPRFPIRAPLKEPAAPAVEEEQPYPSP